jgi:hypothetical protein
LSSHDCLLEEERRNKKVSQYGTFLSLHVVLAIFLFVINHDIYPTISGYSYQIVGLCNFWPHYREDQNVVCLFSSVFRFYFSLSSPLMNNPSEESLCIFAEGKVKPESILPRKYLK